MYDMRIQYTLCIFLLEVFLLQMKSFNNMHSLLLVSVELFIVVALHLVDSLECNFESSRSIGSMPKASSSSLDSSMSVATTHVCLFLPPFRSAVTTFFTMVFRYSPFNSVLLLNFTRLL